MTRIETHVTLRDYFAAAALAGILAAAKSKRTWSWRQIAEEAYECADTLLDVRDESEEDARS